jgi:hypothetical protein
MGGLAEGAGVCRRGAKPGGGLLAKEWSLGEMSLMFVRSMMVVFSGAGVLLMRVVLVREAMSVSMLSMLAMLAMSMVVMSEMSMVSGVFRGIFLVGVIGEARWGVERRVVREGRAVGPVVVCVRVCVCVWMVLLLEWVLELLLVFLVLCWVRRVGEGALVEASEGVGCGVWVRGRVLVEGGVLGWLQWLVSSLMIGGVVDGADSVVGTPVLGGWCV